MKGILVVAGCAAIAAFTVTTLAGADPGAARIAAGVAGVLCFTGLALARREDR